jgi:hypothetical protein
MQSIKLQAIMMLWAQGAGSDFTTLLTQEDVHYLSTSLSYPIL